MTGVELTPRRRPKPTERRNGVLYLDQVTRQIRLALAEEDRCVEVTSTSVAGDVSGTLADVVVTQARGLRESGGATLAMASVADGDLLARSGSTVDGVAPASGLDVSAGQLRIRCHPGTLSKNHNPASQSYAGVSVTTLVEYDAGAGAQITMWRGILPARVSVTGGLLYAQMVMTMDDGSEVELENTQASAFSYTIINWSDAVAGSTAASAINNGKSVKKLAFAVRSTAPLSQTGDMGEFIFRGQVIPSGSGSVL